MYKKLLESIDPSGKRFLLCSVPIEWDWDNAGKYIQKEFYNLVGFLPQIREEGKPYFIPSDKDVFQAYSSVVNAANPSASDAYVQAVNDAERLIAEAKNKLDTDRFQMKEEMKEEKGEPGFNANSWMKETGWDIILEKDRQSLAKYNDDKAEIVGRWDPEHKAALKALEEPLKEDEKKKGFVKMQVTANKFELYPNFIIDVKGEDWARKARLGKAGGSKEFQLSISSLNVKQSKSEVGFEAGLNLFFTKIFSVKGEGQKVDIEQEIKNMSISIKFKAHTAVTVHPDPGWYNASYLAKLARNDRWKEPSDSVEKLFGHEGFHSVITGFVAVFQPSLTITMSEKAMTAARLALKGNMDISIPPFTAGQIPGISIDVGASGSHSQSSLSAHAESNSLTIESTSDKAQILGVYVANPGGVKV